MRRIINSNYESAEAVFCCLVISKRVENFQLGADGKATKAKWYNLYMRSETDALIIAINNCGGVTIFSLSRAQHNSIRTDAAIHGNTCASQSLDSILMKTFHFDQIIIKYNTFSKQQHKMLQAKRTHSL